MQSYKDLMVTMLAPDDPGESAEDFHGFNRAQDDAFCAAMDKAMKRGKESPRRGIRTTSVEGVVLRTIRPETFVRRESSLAACG